jgi:tricorn protease-like protein|tara:strand:- start:1361 stop:1798 length:438 start_codon:yes stop_codon:yes gene_type:complete
MGLPPALLGRPISLAPSPEAPLLAVTNHRNALLIVDVDAGTCRTADVSEEQGGITHVAWSPCGCWVAYTKRVDSETTLIRILDARTGVTRDATTPVLGDCDPGWDPAGDFLYFLSSRELEPAYDAHRFGLRCVLYTGPHTTAFVW